MDEDKSLRAMLIKIALRDSLLDELFKKLTVAKKIFLSYNPELITPVEIFVKARELIVWFHAFVKRGRRRLLKVEGERGRTCLTASVSNLAREEASCGDELEKLDSSSLEMATYYPMSHEVDGCVLKGFFVPFPLKFNKEVNSTEDPALTVSVGTQTEAETVMANTSGSFELCQTKSEESIQRSITEMRNMMVDLSNILNDSDWEEFNVGKYEGPHKTASCEALIQSKSKIHAETDRVSSHEIKLRRSVSSDVIILKNRKSEFEAGLESNYEIDLEKDSSGSNDDLEKEFKSVCSSNHSIINEKLAKRGFRSSSPLFLEDCVHVLRSELLASSAHHKSRTRQHELIHCEDEGKQAQKEIPPIQQIFSRVGAKPIISKKKINFEQLNDGKKKTVNAVASHPIFHLDSFETKDQLNPAAAAKIRTDPQKEVNETDELKKIIEELQEKQSNRKSKIPGKFCLPGHPPSRSDSPQSVSDEEENNVEAKKRSVNLGPRLCVAQKREWDKKPSRIPKLSPPPKPLKLGNIQGEILSNPACLKTKKSASVIGIGTEECKPLKGKRLLHSHRFVQSHIVPPPSRIPLVPRNSNFPYPFLRRKRSKSLPTPSSKLMVVVDECPLTKALATIQSERRAKFPKDETCKPAWIPPPANCRSQR